MEKNDELSYVLAISIDPKKVLSQDVDVNGKIRILVAMTHDRPHGSSKPVSLYTRTGFTAEHYSKGTTHCCKIVEVGRKGSLKLT